MQDTLVEDKIQRAPHGWRKRTTETVRPLNRLTSFSINRDLDASSMLPTVEIKPLPIRKWYIKNNPATQEIPEHPKQERINELINTHEEEIKEHLQRHPIETIPEDIANLGPTQKNDILQSFIRFEDKDIHLEYKTYVILLRFDTGHLDALTQDNNIDLSQTHLPENTKIEIEIGLFTGDKDAAIKSARELMKDIQKIHDLERIYTEKQTEDLHYIRKPRYPFNTDDTIEQRFTEIYSYDEEVIQLSRSKKKLQKQLERMKEIVDLYEELEEIKKP